MRILRRLSIGRFLTYQTVPKKHPFRCIDGPWKDRTLWLCTWYTLYFNIDGQVGRYVRGKWELK